MSDTRTIQERAREHGAYIGCDPRSTRILAEAADRIDALVDVLRDATEAESLLKPEQRSPWFTKALAVLSQAKGDA